MLGEFLLRLAIALPLVCALAAVSLWAVRRGWIRLPGMPSMPRSLRQDPRSERPLSVLAMEPVGPAARIAVLRFADRRLLVGIAQGSMVVLAEDADRGAPGECGHAG